MNTGNNFEGDEGGFGRHGPNKGRLSTAVQIQAKSNFPTGSPSNEPPHGALVREGEKPSWRFLIQVEKVAVY